MKISHPTVRALILPLGIAATGWFVGHGAARAWIADGVVTVKGGLLVAGEVLPSLEAKTLSGEPARLPAQAQGHAALLVIGFSKAAAKTTRLWVEGCRSEVSAGAAEPRVYCFDVRMLEGVPGLLRGMVERGMRSGFPAELQRQTLLVYKDNDAWRERLGVVDDKTAYIVAIDARGYVRGAATGPFTSTELERMMRVGRG